MPKRRDTILKQSLIAILLVSGARHRVRDRVGSYAILFRCVFSLVDCRHDRAVFLYVGAADHALRPCGTICPSTSTSLQHWVFGILEPRF